MWWRFNAIAGLMVIVVMNGAAQPVEERWYRFDVEAPLQPCDLMGRITSKEVLIAPPDAKFILVDKRRDTCIIRFLLNGPSRQYRLLSSPVADFTKYHYFCMPTAQLEYKAHAVRHTDWGVEVGQMLIPVKMRFQPFDFTKDISLGTTAGVRALTGSARQTAVAGLAGIGITGLTIDSASSNGAIITPADVLAFTLSVGVVFEFGHAQLGCFTGFDFLTAGAQRQYHWRYRHQPWLSFGVGYALYSYQPKK